MDDNASISIQEGFKNDLTSEGFTFQLEYGKLTLPLHTVSAVIPPSKVM